MAECSIHDLLYMYMTYTWHRQQDYSLSISHRKYWHSSPSKIVPWYLPKSNTNLTEILYYGEDFTAYKELNISLLALHYNKTWQRSWIMGKTLQLIKLNIRYHLIIATLPPWVTSEHCKSGLCIDFLCWPTQPDNPLTIRVASVIAFSVCLLVLCVCVLW